MGSDAVRVKICGITRAADAETLDGLGADFLGFNFHPASKRFVEPAAAAAMIRRLRRAEPVGVFVDAPAARIAEVAALTGIRWAQLHGREKWDLIESVALPVIKAIPQDRLADYGGLREDWERKARPPAYLLIDTRIGSEFGGTGKAFDWKLLPSDLPAPFFLAGGLGPENLAEALSRTRPFAVDLNSRVEKSPGVKDLAKVEACFSILSNFRI